MDGFKGTVKIHQIKLTINNNILQARRLTCLDCDSYCPHFDLGNINVFKMKCSSENAEDSLMETEIPSTIDFDELLTGMWVVVEYERILFPGEFVRVKS